MLELPNPQAPKSEASPPGQPAEPPGKVVVTKDLQGHIVCVTRQDEEGRILSVISESTPYPNLDCKITQRTLAAQWGYTVAGKKPAMAPSDIYSQRAKPAAWVLTSALTPENTSSTTVLWFVNPENAAWTPLYRHPSPRALSRAEIRDVFLSHGFTIKDGCTDLKPYVYEAAFALLAK